MGGSTVEARGGGGGGGGGGVPHLVVSSTTLKKLLDHTFSTFRITISETSTLSACRFLETI
jgi:hypothetical protein